MKTKRNKGKKKEIWVRDDTIKYYNKLFSSLNLTMALLSHFPDSGSSSNLFTLHGPTLIMISATLDSDLIYLELKGILCLFGLFSDSREHSTSWSTS